MLNTGNIPIKPEKLKALLDIVVGANERFIQCNEDELVSFYSGMMLVVVSFIVLGSLLHVVMTDCQANYIKSTVACFYPQLAIYKQHSSIVTMKWSNTQVIALCGMCMLFTQKGMTCENVLLVTSLSVVFIPQHDLGNVSLGMGERMFKTSLSMTKT